MILTVCCEISRLSTECNSAVFQFLSLFENGQKWTIVAHCCLCRPWSFGPHLCLDSCVQLPEQAAALSDRPLPQGWEERMTNTGRKYYVCHETRTTQVRSPSGDDHFVEKRRGERLRPDLVHEQGRSLLLSCNRHHFFEKLLQSLLLSKAFRLHGLALRKQMLLTYSFTM